MFIKHIFQMEMMFQAVKYIQAFLCKFLWISTNHIHKSLMSSQKVIYTLGCNKSYDAIDTILFR